MTSTAKTKSSEDQNKFGVNISGYLAETPDGERVFLVEITLSGVKQLALPWAETTEKLRNTIIGMERLEAAMDLRALADKMLTDLEKEFGSRNDH
ncbi:MAG: hypothetical protein HC888_01055 [Candidatus Competibacteraceae bacterium]|nr:hypothetical protein [Candidatus Competibacteraceae bacterium]